jgi:phosphoglycolate phosphatase
MRLLTTDLDNTLYDWVTYFARSFQAMARALSELISTPQDRLLREFKAVHQRYGNSEQPFAMLELPSVRERFGDLPDERLLDELELPLRAFKDEREHHLRLYETVEETLRLLHSHGIVIVGHTEASPVNAYFRLKFLKIDCYFRRLYSLRSKGKLKPHPRPGAEAEFRPPDGLLHELSPADRKPNPQLLRHICAREGIPIDSSWYVGDSLTRDISMARRAGVESVWARYGTRHDPRLWEILVAVTHWTPEDVAREEELRLRFDRIEPDHTIDRFSELAELLEIGTGDESRTPILRRAVGAV